MGQTWGISKFSYKIAGLWVKYSGQLPNFRNKILSVPTLMLNSLTQPGE